MTNAINNLGVYCNVTRSEMNEAEKNNEITWRKEAYGDFSNGDELGTSIVNAVKKIDNLLSPITRFEGINKKRIQSLLDRFKKFLTTP